jgi:dTMP kinase
MTPGRFITLEGGDGCGKTTQLKALAAMLQRCGIAVVATREPGGSPGAEDIRGLLVNGTPGRWDALTETLLLYAARHDHIERTIKPALAAGRWVLSDRFVDSTYAYQGAGGGVNRETIRRIESVSIGDFKPNLTLILDLPVACGLARTAARAGTEKRFEQFDLGFHQRLRQGFLDLAHRFPQRCVVIDASGDEGAVAAAVWKTVSARFALPENPQRE